ncbi:hypothetical protein pEaSNUABM11_00024 [Erwinia phage pEa_SNUABM_11]|nr:hypothetical protein pEaSNUABM11_00024 [Erwinia phage pEa_SNUABM_11]
MSQQYFLIHNYQFNAGPLTEFDPNSILREINTDVNNILNTAVGFIENQSIGELDYQLPNTMNYVTNELNARGIIIEGETVMTYSRAIQEIAKLYVQALSESPFWITRFAQWCGARYSDHVPDAVEMVVDFNIIKFEALENQTTLDNISPIIMNIVHQLIGSLGGGLRGL